VRQARLPVGRQQLGLFRDRVDIVGQRQRDDVGVDTIDDAARLCAGATVGQFDRDLFAGLLLPVLGETGVVVSI